MDPKKWVRNAEKVHDALMETEDGQFLAKKRICIYIPEFYLDKDLAEISSNIYTLGVFLMVVEDQFFAVSNALAKIRIKPTVISTVTLKGEKYLEFAFDPGSVVIADRELIRDDFLVYLVFDTFISKGRAPWFLDYRLDMGALFESAGYHGGLNLGNNHVMLDVIAASVTRQKEDPRLYYRHAINTMDDLVRKEPVIIALNNVAYGATNTVARLIGAYFGEGLNSALVTPSEKVERLESILRA